MLFTLVRMRSARPFLSLRKDEVPVTVFPLGKDEVPAHAFHLGKDEVRAPDYPLERMRSLYLIPRLGKDEVPLFDSPPW